MNKILVIDDNEALRRTLEVALGDFGYETASAPDGETGVQKAREWLPDLILCDVNMPGISGREVLQILRTDPILGNRQVVLMTGNQAQNPLREGMNLGADDYLPKPFEISQLRTCVDARLRRAQIYRRLENSMLRRHAEMFGSTLPHEFMTPLNGILGFAEILKEDLGKIPNEESVQMLSDIESCARRLHRTLMNYLTLVTIESAPDEEGAKETSWIDSGRSPQIISAVAQAIAEKAGRRLDLVIEVEPLALHCSENDLHTIVEHLVENAFGFSTAGAPVTVSFKQGAGQPILRVQDRGRGMSPDQIEQIGLFMQFERKRFEQQGLGIGLAIVKRLLERCRGKIVFESTPGKGTTVTVEFHPA